MLVSWEDGDDFMQRTNERKRELKKEGEKGKVEG